MKSGLQKKRGAALLAAALLVLAACGGGGGSSSGGGGDGAAGGDASPAPTGAVASNMQPQLNGWAFPNFPSATFPDVNFDTADLVSMFGSGADVCVDGVAEPCTLTAEAAAWARMVNQARATGHCEGMVVLASARFNKAELPETVKLPSQEEEIRALLRAFATQFVPEVQEAISKWTKASLAEKVDELKRSLATDKLEYTLGVYVEGGGHAVLPYAVEYPTPDVARIMVYDSNWPGRNRYVDVDLAADKWSFSFAGDDPAADPNLWTGGSGDMDLTPFEAREGSCPFCDDGTTLQSTTLLVRTEDLNWSVETETGVVSPDSSISSDGASARPVKGGVTISRLAPQAGGRSSYDYLITIPNSLLEEPAAATATTAPATTAASGATTKKRAKLKFGGASSVFAVMKTGVAQFTTPGGGEDNPVELGTTSIKSNDPSVDLTLASGNLVANASGPSVELGADGGTLAVAVTTATGEVIQQEVTPDAPAVQVKADETGGVTVLEATATGEVTKTEVAADGTRTETVVDASALNLNKVEVELPPALVSKPIEALPSLEDRNLNNPSYKVDEAYVPPTTVPAVREVAAGPTTTAPRSETASTVQTRNAALPTTTVAGRSVTAAGATPTTVAAVVRPTLTGFRIPAKTFGDEPFTLDPPDSNSPGGFRYASSNSEVATVVATTGRVTIVGAGSATITVTQAAVRGFEAGTISATLSVAKARPTIGSIRDLTRTFGDDSFSVADPQSDSTAAFTYTSSNEDVLRRSRTTGRWVIAGAGRATITVSQAATDDFLAASTTFSVTVRKGAPEVKPPADIAKKFLDADFDLSRPTSDSRGAFTYTSSDSDILSVTGTKASIKSAGSVTITASQAATDDWLAASTTYKVNIAAVEPTVSGVDDMTKTYGDPSFTIASPTSASAGAFTYSSSDEKVARVGATDGRVTIIGAGTATLTIKQAANKGYAETTLSKKITVNKAAPTISDLLIADKNYGGSNFSILPTSNSDGAFTFSTDNSSVFSVDATTGQVTIVGVGTATLTARQAATTNYESGSTSASVTVRKGTPTLSWSPATKTFGDAPYILDPPTSSSAGSFSYSVASADASRASVNSAGQLTILGAGTVSMTATQASNSLWNSATITATLTINKATPTLSAFTVPTKRFGDSVFSLTAPTSSAPVTASSFTYEITPGAATDVATVQSNGQVTVLKVGSTSITARQTASANFTTASITATFTVERASQNTLTTGLIGKWSFDSSSTLGTNSAGNGNLTSVSGPSWTSSGKFGGALSLNGSGARLELGSGSLTGLPVGNSTYTVAAWIKPSAIAARGIIGWGNYGAGNQVNAFRLGSGNTLHNYWWGNDLIVSRPSEILANGSWIHVAANYDGTTRRIFVNGAVVASDTPGTASVTSANFAIGKTLGQEYFHGSLDDVVIYNRALSTSEINSLLSGVSTAITITSTSGTYGTPLTLAATGGAGTGDVTFSLVSAGTAGCSIDGDLLTSTSGGTCVVRATKAGDENYDPESSTDTTVTINRIAQTSSIQVTSLTATAGTNLTLTATGGSGSGSYTYSVVSAGTTGCSIQNGSLVTTATGTCTVTATRAGDDIYLSATSASFAISVQGITPTMTTFGSTVSGLSGVRYVGYFNDNVDWFAGATRHGETQNTTDFNYFTSSYYDWYYHDENEYSWEWTGEFLSSTSGTYQFCIASDDASYLWLGETARTGFTTSNSLVSMPGLHPMYSPNCATVELASSTRYPIRIQFGEYYGGDALTVSFQPPGANSPIYDGTGYFFSNGTVDKAPQDPQFTPTLPTSNSPGAITYSSSDSTVASINATTGLVTIGSVGTATLTATQAASGIYGSTSRSFDVRVAKIEQATVTLSTTQVSLGYPSTLVGSGGSGAGTFSFAVADAGTAGCSISGSSLTATSVGTCSVVATRAADARYNAKPSAATTVDVVQSAIVQANLLSYLDAGNSASYSGSGNIWYDLSGNQRNATMYNITYDSAGHLNFSGAGYADWGRPLATGSSYSIDAWVWRTNTGGNQNIASTNQSPFWFPGAQLCAGIQGSYSLACVANSTTGAWMHVAMTFDDAGNSLKLFLNGTQVQSVTTGLTFTEQWLTIGAHNDGNAGAMSNLVGRIGEIRLYNRALTATEIQQNYAATNTACRYSSCVLSPS